MEEKKTNVYEITFYTKVEDAAPVKTAVKTVDGEVLEERPFEKVRLEFPIKKESYAFMGVLRVSLGSEAVALVARALLHAPGVLRCLITTPSPAPTEDRSVERRPMERKRPPSPRVAPQESSILTNEALERKIEEILQ
ncbi:MAG: hypothetical protein Q8P88_02005 [Candidatus Jorgensenbacteria bacterium]|nr:hypothetical protein [Candidatus Jorgensenbacteria bacterium]